MAKYTCTHSETPTHQSQPTNQTAEIAVRRQSCLTSTRQAYLIWFTELTLSLLLWSLPIWAAAYFSWGQVYGHLTADISLALR